MVVISSLIQEREVPDCRLWAKAQRGQLQYIYLQYIKKNFNTRGILQTTIKFWFLATQTTPNLFLHQVSGGFLLVLHTN